MPPLRPIAALLAAGLLACLSDTTRTTSNTTGPSLTRSLFADLTGAAEVPGPGDPDGFGSARLSVDHFDHEICFEIVVQNIDPAFAAHIHEGSPNVAGPIAIGLAPPSTGVAIDCVSDVSPELIAALLESPSHFYINVHTPRYPAGAVRGQLTR